MESDPSAQSLLTLAPPGALLEFERLRHALGFASEEPRLIDGRYRVDRTLGRGAMGEVLLAYDHRLERQVALKLVRASAHINLDTLRARLEREALALARVDHVNVIAVYDVGTHDEQPYFTMQFVPGEDLREWQLGTKRTPAELIEVYLQAGRGLEAAHRGGLVHRDFKPDNVLVGEDMVVRVLDFGIAAALRPQLPALAEARDLDGESADTVEQREGTGDTHGSVDERASGLAPMTRAGTLLGTLPYMSPEQLEGRQADAFSDQFAFCVAMWEALTGTRPHSGRSVGRLRERIDAGPEGGAKLPRWLRPLLTRGLAVDPRQRWPNMGALIHAIDRGRKRGRRVAVAVGLSLSLVGASALGRSSVEEAPPFMGERCETYLASVDASWTPERRAALEQRPGSAYALATIDRLAMGWRQRAKLQCQGEAAPAKTEPVRACLDTWVESFDSTLELLVERGDGETFARAPDLLARLEVVGEDDCARLPERPVDPELWRLAEDAGGLVLLGEIDAAAELGEAALARAEQLSDARFGVDQALAHFARGEVAAFAGDWERAMRELAASEAHALGGQAPKLLLSSWTLAAKLAALGGQGERAAAFVDRAEPLVFALELGDEDPRRAELLEARGLTARTRGRGPAAVDFHRQAKQVFEAAERPTLAVKSLINIGANLQDLEQLERAAEVYAEAIALLEAAGVPPGYRNRIQLERNLGLLAYEGDRGALQRGLEHFAFVVEHGTATEALDAHELLVAVALELGDEAEIEARAEAALAALDARAEPSVDEQVRLRRAVGLARLTLGDARGEPMLEAAAAQAESLPLLVQYNLHASWIDALEKQGRCAEAEERRRALTLRVEALPAEQRPPAYAPWADYGPKFRCAKTPTTKPQ